MEFGQRLEGRGGEEEGEGGGGREGEEGRGKGRRRGGGGRGGGGEELLKLTQSPACELSFPFSKCLIILCDLSD